MSNIIEYKDIIAFYPGYYIAEVIDDMGITHDEFATRLGTTPTTICKLVNGKINLSVEIAKKLSVMLGTSIDVWLNLQTEFDKKVAEIQTAKDTDAQAEVLDMIDYSFFVKVAHLPAVRTVREKIASLCQYLHVADLRVFTETDFLVNYRTGIREVQVKNTVNSGAWLQTAINISAGIPTEPYNAKRLRAFLPELRTMTVQPPEVFVPRMREIFAQCGVAFVILPHLKNSGINGAVKWLDNDRAVLAINTRGAYADKFWFTLFHEIQHIFQHKLKTTFITWDTHELKDMNAVLEQEADRFAMDFLIPPQSIQEWSPTFYTKDADIISFAASIGIHPGIVAGRLQHDKIIADSRCSKLKVKYTIAV